MAEYPSPVRDRKSTFDARAGGVTQATISYPDSVSSGDRLILLISGDTAQTYTVTGWTELVQSSGTDSLGLFWQTADGTEGGTTFTVDFTTADRDMNAIVWAIPSSGTPEVSTVTTTTATTHDVPSLTPSGGSDQYLWLSCGAFNGAGTTVRDWPEGFGAWLTATGGPSTHAAACERVETASSLDPGTFGHSGSTYGKVALVAVPVSTSAPADYPVPESVEETQWTTAQTTQAITLPGSIASGDYLTAEITVGDDRTVTFSGWTQLAVVNQDIYIRTYVFERTADGTEGATDSITISSTGAQGAAIVRRFTNVDTAATEVATNSGLDTGASLFNWPSLTPTGGSGKIAWIVGASLFGDRVPYRWGYSTDDATINERADMQDLPAWIRAPDNGTSRQSLMSAIYLSEVSSLHPDNTNAVAQIRFCTYVVAVYPPGGGGGGGGAVEGWGFIPI